MRLRNLLAATAVSALVLGTVGIPAYATTAADPANPGTVIAWGNESDYTGGAAIPVPNDLTGPVRSVATNEVATGVVTVDGGVRVWGMGDAPEVTEAPTGITDASAIVLGEDNGAVLHTDGHITAWGASEALSQDVPVNLRAKAIALETGPGPDTGYAVRTDGSLTTWGDAPSVPAPVSDWDDLVDVSASPSHVLALHADGTVSAWGYGASDVTTVPDFGAAKVAKIAAGNNYSGVVLDDGTIRFWGSPPSLPRNEPDFDGQTPAGKVVSLSVNADTSPLHAAAALTADGTVHVWGVGPKMTDVPASLTGKPVTAIALSDNHVAAVYTPFRDLTKPTLTGTPTVGQTLTATPATFSLAPDAPATGQWYAANAPIAGETATTLVLDGPLVGKVISYRTAATRGDETVTAASTPIGPVTKAASAITLNLTPASAAAGSRRTVTATVTSPVGTPTGSVVFTSGTTHATAALVSGKATWTVTTLSVGRHAVTTTYSGDSDRSSATSAAATLNVTKATSRATGKAKATGVTKKVAKKVTLTLTVTSAKGVSPAGKVRVTLTGPSKKTLTVSVNAAGKATATIANAKRGTYSAKLAYAGNTSVSSSNGLLKFKV